MGRCDGSGFQTLCPGLDKSEFWSRIGYNSHGNQSRLRRVHSRLIILLLKALKTIFKTTSLLSNSNVSSATIVIVSGNQQV